MQMNRWLGVVGLAAFALGGAACGIGHYCSDRGCDNRSITATLTPQSGTWQQGEYTLDLTMDGRKERCTFRIPSSVSSLSCGAGVRVYFARNVDDFALRLLSDLAPKALSLSLSLEGRSVLAESPTLTYEESYPNGPDCGVCRSASVELTVED